MGGPPIGPFGLPAPQQVPERDIIAGQIMASGAAKGPWRRWEPRRHFRGQRSGNCCDAGRYKTGLSPVGLFRFVWLDI